jgi:hypothetical protein
VRSSRDGVPPRVRLDFRVDESADGFAQGADLDIAAWLHHLGLDQYERAFRDSDVDAEVLASLTADDLRELGVISLGHRKKLLSAIAALSLGPGNEPDPDCKPAPLETVTSHGSTKTSTRNS